MRKGNFVVITGLDGSGTTSLGKALAEIDPKGYFLHTPSGAYSKCRHLFDNQIRIESPAAHYHFYLSSVIRASDLIREKIKTHNVYCVRYLIDTVISHRVAGLNVSLTYNLGYVQIMQPDLTLFIDINEKVRELRISRRGKSELDKTFDNRNFRENFISEFYNFKDSFTTIDNSTSLNACIEQAKTIISQIEK